MLKALGVRAGELVPQSHLHKSLGLSRSRVSEVLSTLEREGLIARVKVGNQYLVKLLETQGTAASSVLKSLKIGVVWSSEYPFLTVFAKRVREKLNISLNVVVFASSLQATKSLVLGDVALALSPAITQVHFYLAFRNFKIVGGGAYGGSAVMTRGDIVSDYMYSSELSTMDLIRSLVVGEGIIPATEVTTRYFRSPEEVIKAASTGLVKYAVVWHPLYRRLQSMGYKALVKGEELDIPYCCTLAVSNIIPSEIRHKLGNLYRESLETYSKTPERWIEWYALQVGIPRDMVIDGIREYGINPHLDKKELLRYFNKVPIKLPDMNALAGEILEAPG
ncbi:MAG: hypothetical protein QXK83_06035 [Zestosphaera sp.]